VGVPLTRAAALHCAVRTALRCAALGCAAAIAAQSRPPAQGPSWSPLAPPRRNRPSHPHLIPIPAAFMTPTGCARGAPTCSIPCQRFGVAVHAVRARPQRSCSLCSSRTPPRRAALGRSSTLLTSARFSMSASATHTCAFCLAALCWGRRRPAGGPQKCTGRRYIGLRARAAQCERSCVDVELEKGSCSLPLFCVSGRSWPTAKPCPACWHAATQGSS
jgi:hypothetical protein